jgi:hypothetical protein
MLQVPFRELQSHSSHDYARLFCPRGQQRVLDRVANLHAEICAIPHTVREPDVALAKLSWWQSELNEAICNRPRHPLTRALSELAPVDAHLLPLWGAIIQGARDRVTGHLPESESSLADHCHKVFGAYLVLLAAVFCRAPQPLDASRMAFIELCAAGIYLNSQALGCLAHGQPCPIARALPKSGHTPDHTIRPVLMYAESMFLMANQQSISSESLIYHHALLKIHAKLNCKALKQNMLAPGNPPRINGFQMLHSAWLGARKSASKQSLQDSRA